MVEKDKEKRAFLLELTTDAQSYIHHGKKDEALNCYERILEKYPDELRALYGKGMTYYQFDELEKALEIFEEVLKRDPNEKDSLYAKGTILNSFGKMDEAIKTLDKVINLEPNFPMAWLAKAYAFIDKGNWELALECFEKVEKLGRQDLAFTGKGHVLRELNQLKKAKANYQLALQIDPYDSEALFGLGSIEFLEENLKEAKELLYKSVVQDAENLEAWKILAEAYSITKDKKREKIARDKIEELTKK